MQSSRALRNSDRVRCSYACGNRLFEGSDMGPHGEPITTQRFNYRGDVIFIDRLTAVRN